MKLLTAIVTLSVAIPLNASPRPQELSPLAPPDKPVPITSQGFRKADQAMAPYVAKARTTLPQAKQKYLAGLPRGDTFFVTVRIYDSGRQFEQVFVRVTSWEGQTIAGALASDTAIIHRDRGEIIICQEDDVMDWTISKADGTEEGNFVGKFLESYRP